MKIASMSSANYWAHIHSTFKQNNSFPLYKGVKCNNDITNTNGIVAVLFLSGSHTSIDMVRVMSIVKTCFGHWV